MSALTVFGVIWAVVSLVFLAIFPWDKYYWNFRGRKYKVDAWLLKFLMIAFLALFVIISLPIHIVFRAVGLRGFWNKAERAYTIQNPFKVERG